MPARLCGRARSRRAGLFDGGSEARRKRLGMAFGRIVCPTRTAPTRCGARRLWAVSVLRGRRRRPRPARRLWRHGPCARRWDCTRFRRKMQRDRRDDEEFSLFMARAVGLAQMARGVLARWAAPRRRRQRVSRIQGGHGGLLEGWPFRRSRGARLWARSVGPVARRLGQWAVVWRRHMATLRSLERRRAPWDGRPHGRRKRTAPCGHLVKWRRGS